MAPKGYFWISYFFILDAKKVFWWTLKTLKYITLFFMFPFCGGWMRETFYPCKYAFWNQFSINLVESALPEQNLMWKRKLSLNLMFKTDLSQKGWKTQVHAVDLELGSPDVWPDFDHASLLRQDVEVVHLLVSDVAEVVRLVPPPSPPVSPSQPRTVERRGGLFLVREVRFRVDI